ncbi:PCYCGC motif-containing (lipo)protein [Alkalicoccobacillus porphyridii]|uniref:Lipoprotein n=1 Tax=Alkalicoccobacillus porphyridii TaxID=2597270 RepID=A0A553ZWE6_9BACI|nr:PCYCGC motif-containing (lipo)protein [Alkalicoccobacillus porphyridii]TSB45788.1 hypothetical protein FN960_14990 [Alkalicoccobacillus porphyridii]
MKRLVLIGVVLLFLAGCQDQSGENAGNEDVYEETASTEILPDFLEYYPDNIANLYQGIPEFKEVLEELPSYDSNGNVGQLDNLYQSFIYEEEEDGAIVWNDHGARCNPCIDSAAYSIEASQNGKSIEEIRETVIRQYGDGS